MKRLSLFVILIFPILSYSQGCSDAGFCTIPSFAPLGEETDDRLRIEFKGSLEASEPGALIFSPQFWVGYQIKPKIRLEVKVPFWFVNDAELGSNYNFSDPIIAFGFTVYKTSELLINLTGSTRIGINQANVLGSSGDLPMDYQSSLGTTDLILGGNAIYKSFSASLAFQLPIWQFNANQNVVAKYATFSGIDTISMEYIRKADLMLRLEKKWVYKNWSFRAGLLPIFHLGDDYLKGVSINGEITIDGSSGLTLNIPLGAWYTHKQFAFGLDMGFPIVTRTERPDGLTRKFVVQPRIAYTFN